MADKQTMQLEYQFIAEDTNLSTMINRVENNLESLNSEAKDFVSNMNKAEKEMKDFGSSTNAAAAQIKQADSAFEHLNDTSKENRQVMKNFATDIAKAKKLTKELYKEQKQIRKDVSNASTKSLSKEETQALTSRINTYKAKMVELKSLDERLSVSAQAILDNREVAVVGYSTAEKGSAEKEYFKGKIQNYNKQLDTFKTEMNKVSDKKSAIMRDFYITEDEITNYAISKRQNILSTDSMIKTKDGKQKFYKKQASDKETLNIIESAKNSLGKVEKLSAEIPGTISSKVDIEVDTKGVKKAEKDIKNVEKSLKETGENLGSLKRNISSKNSQNMSKKDTIMSKYSSKDRKSVAKEQAKQERETAKFKSELKKKEIAFRENEKRLSKRDEIDYKNEQKDLRALNATRENLIGNLTKEANKYEKLDVRAQNHINSLKEQSDKMKEIAKTGKVEEEALDTSTRILTKKSGELKKVNADYEDYTVSSKKLLKDAQDYSKHLQEQSSKTATRIKDLKEESKALEKNSKQLQEWNNSIQKSIKNTSDDGSTKSKKALDKYNSELNQNNQKIRENSAKLKENKTTLNSLESEYEKIQSEIKQLDSGVDRLNQSMNKACDTTNKLGNATDELKSDIDGAKQAIDNYSNSLTKIGTKGAQSMGNLQAKAQNLSKIGNSIKSTGNDLVNVGRELQVISYASAGVFTGAIATGMEYEAQLANVKSTMNTTGKEAGYLDKAMAKIDETVRSISTKSVFSPAEIMESAKYLSLAGYDLDKILTTIEPMSQLMAVTGITDAAEGVNLLTDSLASLGMGMKDLENNETDFQFAKRFEKETQLYIDTMAKLQSVSNQNIVEAMEAMIYAGGEFDRLNIPLEQSGALLGILASRGLKSSEAGRGLSSTLINLTKETGQSYQALKELHELTGIDVFARFDENGAYKLEQQLTNITTAFDKIIDTYGEAKGSEIVNRLTSNIAGKTQIKTFAKLLEGYKQEYSQLKEYLSEDSVAGSMEEMVNRKKDSIEYKFKMMIASIQETMVDLFDTIKPYVAQVIDFITKLADAFRKLSDDDKLAIAKLIALAGIIPVLITVFGGLLVIIGSVISTIGKLGSVIFGTIKHIFDFIKAVGTFKVLVQAGGWVEALKATFPGLTNAITVCKGAMASMTAFFAPMSSGIAGLIATFAKLGGVIFSVFKFFGNVKNLFGGFKDAFASLRPGNTNPLEFLENVFEGTFQRLQHNTIKNFQKLGDSFVSGFAHVVSAITRAAGKVGDALLNLIPDNWGGIFAKLKEFTGFGDFLADRALEKAKNPNKLKSELDIQAIEEGFTSYEDKINSLNGKKLSLGFDIEGLDALDRLVKIHQEGIPLTVENIGRSEDLLSDTVSQYKSIRKLQRENEKSITKESELSTKILETREKMAKYKVGSDDYKKAKEEYDSLVEEKEIIIETRIQNAEEIEKQLAELEEKKVQIQVEYKQAQEQGLGDEYIYHNLNKEFQKEFGISLIFDNKDEVVHAITSTIDNLPDMKKTLELELDSAEGEVRNQIVGMLAQIEKLELSLPIALEIINEQEIMKKYGGENGLVQKQQDKVNSLKKDIAGTKNGGTIHKELTAQLQQEEKVLKEYQDTLQGALDKVEGLSKQDPAIFENAIEFAKTITENKGEAAFKLFSDEDIAFYNNLTAKHINHPPKPEKKEQEAPKKAEKTNSNVKENTKNTQENTKAIEANTKAKENNAKVEPPKVEAKKKEEVKAPAKDNTKVITEQADKMSQALENIKSRALEITNAFSDINMNSLVEVFATVLAMSEELRQKIIDIGNVANNSVKENFSNITAGLDEKIAGIREKIIALGDVANNYVRNSFSNVCEGLSERFISIREQLIGLGDVANNYVKFSFDNCASGLSEKLVSIQSQIAGLSSAINLEGFSAMAQALKTGLDSAREKLLSICNVALSRGVSSMTTMGQSATNGLNTAREKLLSICNVALSRGVSAMASMGNALSNSLSGALSKVASISSQVNSTISRINSIKMPTMPSIPTPVIAQAHALPANLDAMVRTTASSSTSKVALGTSSFNFAIDKVVTNNNADLRQSARQLTTYCKRRGLF